MKLVDSYMFLERLRELIYELLEFRDRVKEEGGEVIPIRTGTPLVRYGFISMLKGGASYIRNANLEYVTTSYVDDFTYSLIVYLKDITKVRILLEDLNQVSFSDLLKFIDSEGVELALRRGMSV